MLLTCVSLPPDHLQHHFIRRAWLLLDLSVHSSAHDHLQRRISEMCSTDNASFVARSSVTSTLHSPTIFRATVGRAFVYRPSSMPRSALDSLSHSQVFLVRGNKTLMMDAGGLNDVAAVPLWVNLHNSGGWNFLSFCQGVRRLVGLAVSFDQSPSASARCSSAPWAPGAKHSALQIHMRVAQLQATVIQYET